MDLEKGVAQLFSLMVLSFECIYMRLYSGFVVFFVSLVSMRLSDQLICGDGIAGGGFRPETERPNGRGEEWQRAPFTVSFLCLSESSSFGR